MDYFYYKIDDNVIGPLSWKEIEELNLPTETKILKKYESEWKSINVFLKSGLTSKSEEPSLIAIEDKAKENRIYMSKKLIAISFLSLMFIFGLFYFFTAKYSITEIDADNHYELLPFQSTNSVSILSGTNIDNYIPDNLPFSLGFELLDSKNIYTNNGLDITNQVLEKGNVVNIRSYRSNLGYTLNYIDKRLTAAFIHKYFLMDENYPNTFHIKTMVNNLVLNEGFLLKKTKLISGHDIVIKETEKSFVIGKLDGKMDNELYPPQSIFFESFSKSKYLSRLGL